MYTWDSTLVNYAVGVTAIFFTIWVIMLLATFIRHYFRAGDG